MGARRRVDSDGKGGSDTERKRERIESKTIDFGKEKIERERCVQRDIESLLCKPKGRDDLSSKIKRVYCTRVYNETKGFLDGRGGMRNG